MAKTAKDLMTPNPVCCTSETTLDQVAKLMLENDCGQIPVRDATDRLIGVVTDRDIVCRVVAQGKNPVTCAADTCMSQPVVTVQDDATFDEVLSTMEEHQIRRVPVVDERGRCVGIIAQADVARVGPEHEVGELVRDVSVGTGQGTHH